MSLQGLPPELLCDVIEHSMPEGFENLMVTCRKIYECGQRFIERHNARKRAWRYVNFDSAHTHLFALVWLHQIVREPILARYIEVFEFSPDGVEFEPGIYWLERAREQKKLQNDPSEMDEIKEFIEGSPYLRMAGVDAQDWTNKMLSYFTVNSHYSSASQMFVFTFILTLLPNVKTLLLPNFMKGDIGHCQECGRFQADPAVWSVMEAIRNNIGKVLQGASLGKLSNLQVIGRANYDTRIRLHTLSSFLAMPSITELYATDCVAIMNDRMIGVPYEWRYPDINSSLRTIELVHCCMDSGRVAQLLAHTPHLRSFKFSRAAKRYHDGSDWDAGAFIATIGKHVGHQLEDLAVTLEDLDTGITTGVTSMRDFTKLKTLELDLRVFDGPATDPGGKYGQHKEVLGEGPVPWTRESITPLTQILPTSLERLDLFSSGSADDLDLLHRLLHNFAIARSEALPNLESCLIRYNGLADSIPEDYKGVQWEFCSDRKPRWREAFYAQFML
ncbi:hypothetical protein F4779DRAFT_609426 [Xylariaceae sp. FL0662B]|nr:hypothetical protein F4779DRAFT_609426 [Xylariaceae sp. FL0662B]